MLRFVKHNFYVPRAFGKHLKKHYYNPTLTDNPYMERMITISMKPTEIRLRSTVEYVYFLH